MKKSTVTTTMGIANIIAGSFAVFVGTQLLMDTVKFRREERLMSGLKEIQDNLSLFTLRRRANNLYEEIVDSTNHDIPFLEVDALIDLLDGVWTRFNGDNGDGVDETKEQTDLDFIPVLLESLHSTNDVEGDLPFAKVILVESINWLTEQIIADSKLEEVAQ